MSILFVLLKFSEFSTQDSMRASDLKRSSVEFNDTPQILSGSRQKNRKQTPSGGVTVTPGLMAGGRSPCKYNQILAM